MIIQGNEQRNTMMKDNSRHWGKISLRKRISLQREHGMNARDCKLLGKLLGVKFGEQKCPKREKKNAQKLKNAEKAKKRKSII